AVWTTLDPAIAQVSNEATTKGLTTAFSSGSTTVLAALPLASDYLVAEAGITVTTPEITSLQITPTMVTVPIAAVGSLQAVVFFIDGSSADVTHESVWSSADPTVAVIIPSGTGAGEALAVGAGSTQITASFNGETDNADITVIALMLSNIDIQPAMATTSIGGTANFTAIGTYTDASTQDLTALVNWSTDDSAIAVMDISQPGLAQGASAGIAQVTAVLDGITSNIASLTVIDKTIRNVQITPNNGTFIVGETSQYNVSVIYTDLSIDDVTALVKIKSLDTSKATFDANNLMTAIAVGDVEITTVYQGAISEREFLHVNP
ncbi:MAG: Ig-like domain-containing protein, partial [Proteobacteria bacterium]|nr:Ig-like domain-containing protein [Pseudomonadota bacterium]